MKETEPDRQAARALIRLRLDLGLTQEEPAKRAGVPPSAIARLESGRRPPSLRSLDKIARKPGLHIGLDLMPGAAVAPGDVAVG